MAARKKAVKEAPAAEVRAPGPPLHDLLDEPTFRVRFTDGRPATLTLPGVLAALGASPGGVEIESFSGLQPHQSHAWHAFLVQLAAIALHRAGDSDPELDETAWRDRLLALTNARHEPWCLVVEDLSEPAFFQPPVPEGVLEGFKSDVATPDELDVLITSKNHDVKASRVAHPSPAHWAYALASLQTMEGYSGRANYGIARMRDVYASRPAVASLPALDAGPRWRREVEVLLSERPRLVEALQYPDTGGQALLWLVPWSGSESEMIPLHACNPLFVEICRRVRLVVVDGQVRGAGTGTVKRRLDVGERAGDTGDIWTPVERAEPGAYRPRKTGFSYEEVTELLLGDGYEPAPAQRPKPNDPGAMWLQLVALVRGQGRTEGLHERLISLSARTRTLFAQRETRDLLAKLAKDRVAKAGEVAADVLRPALKVLVQGAPEKLKPDDDRPFRWTNAFTKAVDDVFFEELWADAEAPREEADRRFEKRLFDLARDQLDLAIEGSPLPQARRYRAIAAAERMFAGLAHKKLKNLYPERSAESAGLAPTLTEEKA